MVPRIFPALALASLVGLTSCLLTTDLDGLASGAAGQPPQPPPQPSGNDGAVPPPDAAADAPQSDAPSDAAVATPRSTLAPYTLDPEEPLGAAPLEPGATSSYLFALAVDGDDVLASVTNDYNAGTGTIYRVAPDGTWTAMASGMNAVWSMQVVGGYLFAMERNRVVRIPLACTSPCGGEEVIVGADEFWAIVGLDDNTVLWMRYTGVISRATRLPGGGWMSGQWLDTQLPPYFHSMAVAQQQVFVAQGNTLSMVVAPLPTPTPKTTRSTPPAAPDAAPEGQSVMSLCDRVFVRTGTGRVFESGTGGFRQLSAAPGLLFSSTLDGQSRYYGMANGGGVFRVTNDASTQIAPGRSAWGMAVDTTYLYYGDHGSPSSPAVLFRRPKRK